MPAAYILKIYLWFVLNCGLKNFKVVLLKLHGKADADVFSVQRKSLQRCDSLHSPSSPEGKGFRSGLKERRVLPA